jgi:LPS export ABC transporter permease LptF/LPS export ABC transporter permease LptG
MRKIDRYVASEIVGPLALGFLVYTFILLIDRLFDSAEMIIRRGIPAVQVGKLLLLSLPNILVLTIPMALLFGILVAVGRLNADSELVALRAGGLSFYSLFRPVLALSILLTVLNSFLMLYLLPRGNSAVQDLSIRILTSSLTRQVEARVFYEEWKGLIIYVFEMPPDEDRWKGVFLAKTQEGAENEVSFADWGEVRVDPDNRDQVTLHLENVITHKLDFQNPGDYHTYHYESVEQVLEDPFAESRRRARRQRYKGLRELTLQELRQRLRQADQPPDLRNLTWVEIHKKFSIPFACLAFGLVALPLGLAGRRSGRATGFVLSIGIIWIYWFLLDSGEKSARTGVIPPWLAMWLPNLFFLGLGIVLLARRNRDKGILPRRLDYWLRSTVGAKLAKLKRVTRNRRRQQPKATGGSASAAARGSVVLRLPRLRLRFPNRLDRYILVMCLRVLALVLLSGFILFTISRLTGRIDEILDNQISWGIVFHYLKYSSLQAMYEFAPIAVLVTTLAVFGILAARNEVTAAKALGVSLYRLAVPALAAAALVVAASIWLEAKVLPAANERAAQLEDTIRGRNVVRTYRRADRNWLFGQGRYIYNYLHYDSQRQALQRLQVFEFGENGGLRSRLYSEEAVFVGDGWRFDKAWTRTFDRLATHSYRFYDRPVLGSFPETPEYFESEVKQPSALSYADLKDYIAEVEASGQAVPDLWVQLHNKISYPAVSFVMGLVALPFSFRLGRRGALYGIGIGVILGMVFLGTVAFSTTLGETGALPPLLAVWCPAVAFALLSGYAFLGVET